MTKKTTKDAAQADALSGHAPESGHPPRSIWRRTVRWILYGLAGLVLLTLVLLGVSLVALHNSGVQAWLVEQVNAALQPAENQQTKGAWARITHLAGPLPFGFQAGVELYDSQGLWLRAPEIAFDWQLGALPQAVQLTALLADAQLLRLPESGPTPPETPSAPLDEAALRQQLGDVLRTLHNLPQWLPEVRLQTVQVKNFRFPQDMLGNGQESASPTRVAADGAEAQASAVISPLASVDVDVQLTAGVQGVHVDSAVHLAPVDAAKLSISGLDARGLEAGAQLALTLPREAERVGLDLKSGLRVQLQGVEDAPIAVENPLVLLLGRGATLDMQLKGGLAAPAKTGGVETASAALSALQVEAGPVRAQGHASWNTNAALPADGSMSLLAGGLDAAFDVTVDPLPEAAHAPARPGASGAKTTPLHMLRAPLKFHLTANGSVQSPGAEVRLECADVTAEGHKLTNTTLRVDSAALHWPELLTFLDNAASNAPKELGSTDIRLHLATNVDSQAVLCDLTIFAALQEDAKGKALQAGLRDLRGNLLGVELSGGLTAHLPAPLTANLPLVEGKLDVRAGNLRTLSALLPGVRLDGEAAIALELQPHSAASASGPSTHGRQNVTLRLRVPQLTYGDGSATLLSLQGLESETVLEDIWDKKLLNARLDLAKVQQADKQLRAGLRAQGTLLGPLEVRLESGGFAAAHLDAVWSPGLVEVKRLDADLPSHKLGLKALPGATVAYGADGLRLKGIDVSLKPAGRVRASAALGQKDLDVQLDVDKVDFVPWRVLVDALPEGSAEVHAHVAGGMAAPTGTLLARVRGLRVPGTALKPLNMDLNGKLERAGTGGALALQLKLDPASVRALGGTECRVEASVPLHYSQDGPPQPAMQGPLRAQVRWNGDVAPLWSLLPVHDQRLAGTLGLALDVGGSMQTPTVKGFVRMDKGRYEHIDLGVLLPSITLRLDLEQSGKTAPGTAKLHFDVGDGRGGTVRIAGRAGLDGKGLDISTTIDHLRPLRRRDVRVDVSGKVAVRGEATAPEVRGQVVVNQGAVLLNRLDVAGNVTALPVREDVPAWVQGKGQTVPKAAAPKKSPAAPKAATPPAQARPAAASGPGLLDLRLLIPGRFLVEGFGLQSEWKADMRVLGSPLAPVISGQVEAAKGQLDILGKQFKLTRGAITFGGGNVANPLLDILLTNQTSTLTANMAITGTVRKMQLTLSSDPALPRDEILAQMLFGKSASELGRLENLRLAAAVAQLAGFGSGDGEGGGVLDTTRQALGMDVLRFNTSGSGSGSKDSKSNDVAADTSVEMGKYLTEDIYVGVQQGAKQGSTAFVIQLEMTPRANVEVRTEQSGTKGGLTWKYNY
ncbi:MAG: translocation/assembly module TamB [Desulfovibrio sp.]|nr:translocation/assembly module TamB [Desulfovibrio sp.]